MSLFDVAPLAGAQLPHEDALKLALEERIRAAEAAALKPSARR